MKAPHSKTDRNTDDVQKLLEQLLAVGAESEVDNSPHQVIYRENKLSLRRYDPKPSRKKATPILIVYALVNRPYITDLEPNRSLIQCLLEKNYQVYLIDWGYPDSTDCQTSFNDYINGYLNRCVHRACDDAGHKSLSLLGICQGGTMSLCYAALHPKSIKRVITLVTPVDFHAGHNPLSQWVANMDIEAFTKAFGNVSGQMITRMFKFMKPFQLNREKYRYLSRLLDRPDQLKTFLKMEKWIHDSPDLAGQMILDYSTTFYQNNALDQNCLELNGQAVRLDNIQCHVMNIFARNDHIVPPESSKALAKHITPKRYHELELPGGHIGVFTSTKTLGALTDSIDNWIAETT